MSLRRLVYISSVGVALLLGVELGARLDDALRLGIPFWHTPDFDRDLTIADSLGRRGRPDGRYRHYKLNHLGFRGPAPHRWHDSECLRIVVLGASESFGTTEAEGKDYPRQIADSLSVDGCAELINAAVVGLPVYGIIPLWTHHLRALSPDVVVLYPSPSFYLAASVPADPFAWSRRQQAHDPPSSVLAKSRAFARLQDAVVVPEALQRLRVRRALDRSLSGKPSDWPFSEVPAERITMYVRDVVALVDSISGTGASVVLATHARRILRPQTASDSAALRSWRQFFPRSTESTLLAFEDSANAALREVLPSRGVLLVDAATELSGRDSLFADLTHFTARGASAMAALIRDSIATVRHPEGQLLPEADGGTP